METYTTKISRFSGLMYTLAQIVFWVLLAVAAYLVLAYVLTIASPYTSRNLLGATITLPAAHTLSGTQLFLPGFNFSGFGLNLNVNTATILSFILTLIPLGSARRLFNELRQDGNPFRPEVVRRVKRLAVALVIVGIAGGIIGFIGAAIVAVLYLIFDYGTALQLESETTL